MKKIKTCVIVAFLLMPLLMPTLIQPVKALSNFWEQNWGDHFEYSGAPINISTNTVVYSEDESQWVKVALVVSIYEYTTDFGNDSVNFRVLLYYDSFADETMLPVPAAFVTLNVQKDLDGSNYYDQCMEVRYSGVRPGFAQSHGLDQSSYLDSTQDDREWWAVKALAYGAGLFVEGAGIVTGLISLAMAWVPQEGPDYMDAGYSNYGLYSWWEDPGYDFDLQNPVRQYALNSIQWTQNYGVNPSKFYGIKVWARVVLHTQHNLIGTTIETAPVYLRIARSHTLSISATSGGNTEPYPGTYHYKEGMSASVTAYAYSGYTFNYWLLDGSTYYQNPITVTMYSDHTLSAYFVKLANLVVKVPQAPPEGVKVWVDGTTYKAYASSPVSVTVTAGQHTIEAERSFLKEGGTPGTYFFYFFDCWSDGSKDNPRTIQLTADTTLTANYVRSKYGILLQEPE